MGQVWGWRRAGWKSDEDKSVGGCRRRASASVFDSNTNHGHPRRRRASAETTVASTTFDVPGPGSPCECYSLPLQYACMVTEGKVFH